MKLSVFACHNKLNVDGQFFVNNRLSDTLQRAQKCGVEGIEYTCAPIEELDQTDLKKGLEKTGMKLSAIGSYYWVTGQKMNLLSKDSRIQHETIKTVKKALDLGAEIGAPVNLGQLRGNLPDDFKPASYYEDQLVEILKDLASYAAPKSATFTFEPENRFYLNWLCTSKDGMRIINKVGYENFKLTLDLKHMNVEENITEALIICRDITHNIHFIDADNTMITANSILNIPDIIRTLCAIQFSGWLVTATTSKNQGEISQDEDLKKTVNYLKSLISQYQ